MRYLLLVLMLSGCASGDWQDFNYGPGDWMAENWGLEVDSPYTYERLENPEIEVFVVDDLSVPCGTVKTNGCAVTNTITCNIYVGSRASEGTLAHEKRHCHGWSHPLSNNNFWYPTSGEKI